MPPTARAINIAFRGGLEDHYWDIATAFCKDGVRVSTLEILHDHDLVAGSLYNTKYSIVLSTTTSPLIQQLPVRLAGGSGALPAPGQPEPVAWAINTYAYAVPQAIGSAQSITLERWEHGDDLIEVEDNPGEGSLDDDRYTMSGTVGNCTVTTPPAFETPPSPASGSALFIQPGTPLSLPIQAADADALDLVSLTAGSLPAGASIVIGSAANPTSATFAWTPSESQIGRYVITVDAGDGTSSGCSFAQLACVLSSRTTRYTITINVVRQSFLPLIIR
jgi:hypothetical protein